MTQGFADIVEVSAKPKKTKTGTLKELVRIRYDVRRRDDEDDDDRVLIKSTDFT